MLQKVNIVVRIVGQSPTFIVFEVPMCGYTWCICLFFIYMRILCSSIVFFVVVMWFLPIASTKSQCTHEDGFHTICLHSVQSAHSKHTHMEMVITCSSSKIHAVSCRLCVQKHNSIHTCGFATQVANTKHNVI